MKHCDYCGSELPTKARYCRRCGQSTASEIKVTTNLSDASIEDRVASSLTNSTVLSGLQNPALENDVEEEWQAPDPASENDIEEEQQPSHPALENDVEEEWQAPDPASENDVEEERQTLQDKLESTPSLLRDLDPEPVKSANLFLDEHPQLDQTPSGKLEAHSPHGSASRRGHRFILRWLLILTVLIIVAGGVVALIGLFHGHLPGTAEASKALSSPSTSKIVRTSGPSLTASVCAGSSTPSTPGTSGGIGFTLSATSGCSSFIAASATSSCLIYPYNSGAYHRYIFDISNATVDSKVYHLVFSIAEYTGPATYNDAVQVTVGIGEGSIVRNFSWLYRSGNVTINSNEQTGTMDVKLESTSSANTIHVVGSWTCGSLIKNP